MVMNLGCHHFPRTELWRQRSIGVPTQSIERARQWQIRAPRLWLTWGLLGPPGAGGAL